MKVLVTVASKHGATKEVGQIIAEELEKAGWEVTQLPPEEVYSVDEYDVIVLGSAVYLTKWMDTARDFVRQYQTELRHKPLWAFSVGLSGVPMDQVQDPSRVGPVLLTIEPRDYQTFAGRLDPSQLSLRERTVARLGGAVEGDFIEKDRICEFAAEIVAGMNE